MLQLSHPFARRTAGRFFISFLLLAGTALAHHGWSGYDEGKTATLTGVIKSTSWSNPHGVLQLEVAAQGSQAAKVWTATLAPPFRMDARGLKQSHLKEGGTVTVVGKLSKTNPGELKVEQLVLNGKAYELRQ